MIPYGRQDISEADIKAVVDVLRSEFLTQGPAIVRFEDAIATRVGARSAVAMNSATSALHAAVAALGVGPGDVVWTSPITFVASANCARYCGAEVNFVDIDPETFNMSVDSLELKLNTAKEAGCLPKVVIPVHMAGQSPDMARIHELCAAEGIRIVEDASHSIGATYKERPVGACRYSDITVFSFHPVKIITTAEGGVATTNDPHLAKQMGLLRSHGVTRDEELMDAPSHGPWYYQQVSLGWNYRITDMQAALGLSQLSRLNGFVDERNRLAKRYDDLLADLPVVRPGRTKAARSSFHLYIVRLPEPNPVRHRQVFEALRTGGVGVNLHYIPVHLQPYYSAQGFALGDFPHSEDYYQRAISLPLHPNLSEAQQDEVVRTLADALK